MKSLIIFFSLLFIYTNTLAQDIGPYHIKDVLVSAINPACEEGDNQYITGMPNDSAWANISDGLEVIGFFAGQWQDEDGIDLVIESGFDLDTYEISVMLNDSSTSITYTTVGGDWILLDEKNDFEYVSQSGGCVMGTFQSNHRIVPLDFETHFDLLPSDVVIGVKIKFGYSNESDLAGMYMIDSSVPVASNDVIEKDDYRIFPNPTADLINIELSNSSLYQFTLLDVVGRDILTGSFNGDKHSILLDNILAGTYFLKVQSLNGSFVEKIIVL